MAQRFSQIFHSAGTVLSKTFKYLKVNTGEKDFHLLKEFAFNKEEITYSLLYLSYVGVGVQGPRHILLRVWPFLPTGTSHPRISVLESAVVIHDQVLVYY